MTYLLFGGNLFWSIFIVPVKSYFSIAKWYIDKEEEEENKKEKTKEKKLQTAATKIILEQ